MTDQLEQNTDDNHILEDEIQQDEALIKALVEEVQSLNSLLSPEAQTLTENLRPLTLTGNVYAEIDEGATLGQIAADKIAQIAGSWRFIGGFAIFMLIWIMGNLLILTTPFDPYPFILLNLGLSTLAALQAPVILMSQNRQAIKDRAVAQNDYQVNLKSELEIADLHRKMDRLMHLMENHHQLVNSLIVLRQQDAETLRKLTNTSHTDKQQ